MGQIPKNISTKALAPVTGWHSTVAFVAHRSCSFFDPKEKLGVVIMANAKDVPIMTILQGIFSVLDYFATYATGPAPANIAKFNLRVAAFWATKELVATNKRISCIYIDEWTPFVGAEELEYVDSNTLKISKTDDLMAEGELVKFYFKNNQFNSVNYAGNTMLPEDEFLNNLKRVVKLSAIG